MKATAGKKKQKAPFYIHGRIFCQCTCSSFAEKKRSVSLYHTAITHDCSLRQRIRAVWRLGCLLKGTLAEDIYSFLGVHWLLQSKGDVMWWWCLDMGIEWTDMTIFLRALVSWMYIWVLTWCFATVSSVFEFKQCWHTKKRLSVYFLAAGDSAEKKRVHSRAYHKAFKQAQGEGLEIGECKKRARTAGCAAVAAIT